MGNSCRWVMSQKLSVNSFTWVRNTSQLNIDFMKIYSKESDERHFLGVDFHYHKKLHDLHKNLPFLPEIMKIGKS